MRETEEIVQEVVDNVRSFVKYAEKDGERILFVSRDKVLDEYDISEEKADDVVETAEEKLGWEKSINLSPDRRRLLSRDPNGYWDRVKRGFQRQKEAWLVPGNFLAGVLAGALIDRWYVQVLVVLLIAGDIVSAWIHGRLDIDD
jgi:hypothetical protein